MDSWFAEADLTMTSVAGRKLFDQVVQLLDHLQPARLDPRDQVVVVEDGETRIKLRHDSEPLLRLEVVLNDGWVHFYGVMGHDEAYSTHAGAEDLWESETIGILADLLRADYTINTYERRGERQRRVVDIGEPYDVTVDSLRSLLPRPLRSAPVDTQQVSFECRPTGPTSVR